MCTIAGAVIGFVVAGGLAIAAFWEGMYLVFSGASHSAQDAAVGISAIFTLPVVLLGSIIGLPIGALFGARLDQRRGMVSITRRVLRVAYMVIGGMVVTLALLTTLFGASVGELIVILTGTAGDSSRCCSLHHRLVGGPPREAGREASCGLMMKKAGQGGKDHPSGLARTRAVDKEVSL